MNIFEFVTPEEIDSVYKDLHRYKIELYKLNEEKLKLQQEISSKTAELYGTGQIDGKNEDTRKNQVRAFLFNEFGEMDVIEKGIRFYTDLLDKVYDDISRIEHITKLFQTNTY